MALIIEDGTGVANANALDSVANVTTYLTTRNREDESDWSGASTPEKEAGIVTATSTLEQLYSECYFGQREFLDVSAARGTLTLTGQPTDTETVVLGSITYTFNTVLGGANSVLIGASVEASIDNLVGAVLASAALAGVSHGVGTVANTDATAEAGIDDTMLAEAILKGTAGNAIVSTETVTLGSWSSATLLGGGDFPIPQSLSFPRRWLYTREGVELRGVPTAIKEAMAEYAVYSIFLVQMQKPSVIAALASAEAATLAAVGNGDLKKLMEKIGPIEESTEFHAAPEEVQKVTNLYRIASLQKQAEDRTLKAVRQLIRPLITTGGNFDNRSVFHG